MKAQSLWTAILGKHTKQGASWYSVRDTNESQQQNQQAITLKKDPPSMETEILE